MTLTVDDFDYNLPHELIAQTPIKERMSRIISVRPQNRYLRR